MFVTFEGIDGSGKSTQIRLLVEKLNSVGIEPVLVREPGGTALSEKVRSLLLDKSLSVSPFAEILLFSAARAQLVEEVLGPRLKEGRVVISDRYFDSTIAYQGAGRQVQDLKWLVGFQHRVVDYLLPQRTYLLAIDPVQARSRLRIRDQHEGISKDRMETETVAFYARVADAYRTLSENEPDRYRVLNGELPEEELREIIWEDFKELVQM